MLSQGLDSLYLGIQRSLLTNIIIYLDANYKAVKHLPDKRTECCLDVGQQINYMIKHL